MFKNQYETAEILILKISLLKNTEVLQHPNYIWLQLVPSNSWLIQLHPTVYQKHKRVTVCFKEYALQPFYINTL